MTTHEQYMQRCLELAKRGAGHVAPNPMVGAVLVHDSSIIGEGWHEEFGKAHAEVNCFSQAIKNGKPDLFPGSTLYVSLEPCAHFGKTPPCTDLIIKNKIPKVVIGVRDPFEEVNGRGIEKLVAAGVEVVAGISEEDCRVLNKRFFTFHTRHRPYVILKWAQTGDGFMAPPPPAERIPESATVENFTANTDSKATPLEGFGEASSLGNGGGRLLISNEYSNRLVHQWRSEEAAILVGTNTALFDDPELTSRLWPGPSPVRLVVDMDLRLPARLKLFDHKVKTIVFNSVKHEEQGNLLYCRISKEESIVRQMLKAMYQLKLQSLIVEGGAGLLQSFIYEDIWDEARVITNEDLIINNGLKAPVIHGIQNSFEQKILSDKIVVYAKSETTYGSPLTIHDTGT